MSWLFDGAEEINRRLERGSSFGLTKDQYGALAHVSMGALRWAGVEPCEIRFLHKEGGEVIPGCDVILYGANYVYTIRMEPQKERAGLYGLPLDSKLGGPGFEMHIHQFTGNDYVGDTLAIILRREGVDVMTLREYLGQDPDL